MKSKKEKSPRNILAEAILKQYQPRTVEDGVIGTMERNYTVGIQ